MSWSQRHDKAFIVGIIRRWIWWRTLFIFCSDQKCVSKPFSHSVFGLQVLHGLNMRGISWGSKRPQIWYQWWRFCNCIGINSNHNMFPMLHLLVMKLLQVDIISYRPPNSESARSPTSLAHTWTHRCSACLKAGRASCVYLSYIMMLLGLQNLFRRKQLHSRYSCFFRWSVTYHSNSTCSCTCTCIVYCRHTQMGNMTAAPNLHIVS